MRDARIDIMRGYAMLTIAINHLSVLFIELGLKRRPVPTLTAYGFSSAAEIFFLLSGYMVGMIYVGRDGSTGRLWARALRIYAYNVGAFVLAMIVAWYFGHPVSGATEAAPTLADPIRQTLRFLLLSQHPDLLGALSLYVIFMLVSPICIRVSRRSIRLCVAVSLALYVTTQLIPSFNLAGGTPGDDAMWNFNPAAWQLIFFGGMVAGNGRVHVGLFRWLEASRRRPIAILLALVVVSLCYLSPLRSTDSAGLWDKQNLGPVRIAHALLVIAALCSVLVLATGHLQNGIARLVALAGRQTLDCYAASIPFTYALGGLWVASGRPYIGYLGACVLIVAAMITVAWLTEFRRRPKRRDRTHPFDTAAMSRTSG